MSEESSAPVESSGESTSEVANDTAPLTAKEKRMLEATVNGRKVKVSEDDLLRDFSKYNSADEKFREAAQGRKEIAEFKRMLAEDPESVLNDPNLPFDRRKIAEKWLMAELEKEMSPQKSKEQERIEELQRENEQYKNRDQEEMTKKEQAEFQKIVESRREVIAKTFQEALALSPLSKDQATSAEVVREMASYMRLCKEAGHDVTPAELAKHVEDRFMNSYKALTENMSGEDLVGFLGKDIINKLRQYDLGQLEARRGNRSPDTSQNWQQSETRQKREFTDPRSLMRK
jgi:hypothetical protein